MIANEGTARSSDIDRTYVTRDVGAVVAGYEGYIAGDAPRHHSDPRWTHEPELGRLMNTMAGHLERNGFAQKAAALRAATRPL